MPGEEDVPRNLSKIFKLFLTLPNCAIKCNVTRKRINQRARYGLEIPVQYYFFGSEKIVDWEEKSVKKVMGSVEKRAKNRVLHAWKLFFNPVLCPLYRKKAQEKSVRLMTVRFVSAHFIDIFL